MPELPTSPTSSAAANPAADSSRRGRSRLRRAIAAATVALTAAGSLVVGNTAPAGASTWTMMFAQNSFLNVAVADGSYAPGARIIQWTYTGTDEQRWNLPDAGQTGQIQNWRSGLCITTDGVAGHWLFQDRCDGRRYQQWRVSTSSGASNYQNPATGLVMDVQGYSSNRGANIDGWYSKGTSMGNSNQWFFTGI